MRDAENQGGGGGGGSNSRGRANSDVLVGRDGGGERGLMAVHYLVLSCFALFSFSRLLLIDSAIGLVLNHSQPRWWQMMSSL